MINEFPRKKNIFQKSTKSKYTKFLRSKQSFVNPFLLDSSSILFVFRFRHRILAKEYENTILDLETKLEQQAKEIGTLRQFANQCIRTECEAVLVDQFTDLSLETDNISLKKRNDELLLILQEQRMKYELAEESIAELKSQCDHYEHYTRVRSELFMYLILKIKLFIPVIVNLIK